MDEGSRHCTGVSDQDHPQEKVMQKCKMVSDEALQIAVKRIEVKSKGEEHITFFPCFKKIKSA